jgi:peptidoglycan/LPS O-acetylase OafA/YrhL
MILAAKPEREPTLDGLRGLAVLLVLIFHGVTQVYSPAGLPLLDALRRFARVGGSGVDLFFVLSGLLIGRNLLRHQAASNLYRVFYFRRACRILPAYLLLLVSFLCAQQVDTLVAVGGSAFFSPAIPLWSYLVFWQNNLMGTLRAIGPWWLVATWSLAVEEHFYLVAPVLRRLTVRTFFWLAATILLLSPLGRWWLVHEANNPAGAIYLTLMRLDSLLVGLLLAALDHSGGTAKFLAWCGRGLRTWLLVFAGLFVLAPSLWPSAWDRLALPLGPGFFALGFGALVLWVRAWPDSGPARAVSRLWLRQLGDLSYFIYLFHLPALYTLHALLRHRLPAHLHWSDPLITLAALLLTVGLAAGSRFLLELPFIRLGQRLQYSS